MLWLAGLPSKLWGWLVGVVALMGILVTAWAKAKQSGVDAQAAAEGRRDQEAASVRIDEENRAARVADPAAELRDKWGR